MSFRTRKDGQVFPTGRDAISSGISSTSIGAPSRTGTVKATPLEFPGQKSKDVGSGIFSAKHIEDRLVNTAKETINRFRKEREDLKAGKKAKDFSFATEEAEPIRKEELKERTSEIKQLRDIIKEVSIGRSKKQKEKNEEDRNDISETIQVAENERKLIEDMNWASTQSALKFARDNQGDKEAKKILEAISRNDFKKAKKLAEERARRTAKVVAENSRLASAQAQEIYTLAGLTQNAEGQYIPTSETPEIARENLGLKFTAEELAQLQQAEPIQAPPKIDADDVLLLSQTDGGTEKLKQWGYIN